LSLLLAKKMSRKLIRECFMQNYAQHRDVGQILPSSAPLESAKCARKMALHVRSTLVKFVLKLAIKY
jgi:phospholipid N-methyltransferase